MKIAIVTAFYEPVNNPRSFRATELAKGFARKGHEVHVFNPDVSSDSRSEKEPNLKLFRLGIVSYRQHELYKKKQKRISKCILSLKKTLYYFTTNTQFLFFLKLRKKIEFEERYDLLISIGLPFHVHWVVAEKIKKKVVADCYIADYGDPFSFNETSPVAPYFRIIEKWALKYFDFITCPTKKAVSSYLWLKPIEKIAVVPQGFDFSKIKIEQYNPNLITTFSYAGSFYSDIRNPKILFELLIRLDSDFRFIIYTNKLASDSYSCIMPYVEMLGPKLQIYDLISRELLIKKLSTYDFIINMNNTTSNQVPSKIVDYVLAQRPIFSFSQDTIDEELFKDFLKGDFSRQKFFDISKNNIEYVIEQFIELYDNRVVR